MNAVDLIFRHARERPDAPALWMPPGKVTTFGELAAGARRARATVTAAGVGPGDAVLLAVPLGPLLYALVLGIGSLGATSVLVEPWMPVARIDAALATLTPKAFVSSGFGFGWGARVGAIRRIPRWVRAASVRRAVLNGGDADAALADLDPGTPAIVTFTSGTTGAPKGMVRSHGYLVEQHRILMGALGHGALEGADITVFANFVLANLASGRPSLIVPPRWKPKHLAAVAAADGPLAATSVTCGPAFLLRLLDVPAPAFAGLRSIHVGGALTDCAIFERGFERWPDAHWVHVYGSTEAEPVAIADARAAVAASRARGWFQTLSLGQPVADIEAKLEPDTVWVAGPHVCPRYLGADEENARNKRTDPRGRTWHRMGDRVTSDGAGWWYAGRDGQPAAEFVAEQRLYAALGSSAAFVERGPDGLRVFCQRGREREAVIRQTLPETVEVRDVRIRRDRRHRARIDRAASAR